MQIRVLLAALCCGHPISTASLTHFIFPMFDSPDDRCQPATGSDSTGAEGPCAAEGTTPTGCAGDGTTPLPAGPPPDSESEPCPTPLAWQDILRALSEDTELWQIRHAGRTIRGRTWGSGQPLYFLNGFAATHELFALLAWLLRDQFRIVLFDDSTFDPAGPPLSTEAGAGLPAEQLAGELLAVADSQGDERFSLFATSVGCAPALWTMAHAGDRVERAVLHAGFAHRRLSAAERMLATVARRLPGNLRRLPLRTMIQFQNQRPWFPPFDETRWEFYVEHTGQMPLRTLGRRAAIFATTDLRPDLAGISQPVLLISTEGEGAVIARGQEELAAGLPAPATEWLHSSGGVPYLTHPHRLARLVETFHSDEPAPTPTPSATP